MSIKYDRLLQGTILIITHRQYLLTKADLIWYLENGELKEVGTPQELLNRPSYTAKLFWQQPASSLLLAISNNSSYDFVWIYNFLFSSSIFA